MDVKDPISEKNLLYKKTIGKYVCKVEPIRAILEPEYFVELIEKAERAREKQIEKIELGYKSEGDEEPEAPSGETDWDKIQKMPDSEYLLRTVLPVLY